MQYRPMHFCPDLPEYLKRYIQTRHSAFEELARIIPENELVSNYIQERDQLGLRHLGETTRALTYSRAAIESLLDQLSAIDSLESPSLVVLEVARRVPSLASHEQTALADTLLTLCCGSLPPVSRVQVDRAMMRILPLLSPGVGQASCAARVYE
jgi:hypothetical protein